MIPQNNTTTNTDGCNTIGHKATMGFWVSLCAMMIDLWRVPTIWATRFKKISVPELIDSIEKETASLPGITSHPILIGLVTRFRTILTIRWRRNRCLLKGLLLIYFFSRAERSAIFHLSCHLTKSGNVSGHCWVSQPNGKEEGPVKLKKGWVEIYTHRIFHPKNEIIS